MDSLVLSGFISEATKMFYKVIDWAKDSLIMIKSLAVNTYEFMYMYINFFITTFPFDNPKKTFVLSVVYLFMVLGVVFLFSSTGWTEGGIDTLEPKQVNIMGVTSDPGSGIGGGEGDGSTTSTLPRPPQGFHTCVTDQDCELEPGMETLCCLPEQFEGYSCAGLCLADPGYSRDFCKHPNSCFYEGATSEVAFAKHVGEDPARCDVKKDQGQLGGWADATRWCQTVASDTAGVNQLSVCCHNLATPCYGYCLKPGITQPSCFSIEHCYEESALIVSNVFGGDIR